MSPSPNLCCRGEAVSIVYPECVSVALVIHHAKRKHRIRPIFSCVACLALLCFSILSHKWNDFQKNFIEH
jgi:hypothetical protein